MRRQKCLFIPSWEVFEQHFKLETAIEGYEEDRNTCLYPRKKLLNHVLRCKTVLLYPRSKFLNNILNCKPSLEGYMKAETLVYTLATSYF